ncbi:MAG: hypothetical protein A2350_00670 [Candidatus Raymondbacteria bacterium RifOxyB12_full_50_8]|nr:MAG: hypothetical protein A2350_00670 [Candidatus Raymondbacteria bacterium RifOxyB12_full_50_8]
MKHILALALTGLLGVLPAFSNEKEEELVRLAVLELEQDNATPMQASSVSKALREELTKTGMYYVLSAADMNTRLNAAQQSIPAECHTEQCALDAGQTFAVSKVVVGELGFDEKVYILRLKMFDLESRDFESKVTIAAECIPAKLPELARAGVLQLLGLEVKDVSLQLIKYKGKEVNNKKEWFLAAGLTTAAAFIWGAASGAFSPSGEKNSAISEVADYDMGTVSRQHGAFADLSYSARAHGMGGAFIALSDDANAMVYNPAGMVRVKGRTFTAGYMHYTYGSGSLPYVYSGYVNKVTRTVSAGQALITSSGSGIGSNETQVITSVAKVFDDLSERLRPISVGVNVKFLMMTANKAEDSIYAWQDFAVSGGGFGASVDLGAQFELSERITAALLIRDIAGTVKYRNVSTGKDYNEGVPMSVLIGGHYRVLNSLNLVLDGNKSIYLDTEDHVGLGMEKWLFDALALRLGMSQYFSMNSPRRYHAGLGLDVRMKTMSIGVDYSYEYFPLEESAYMDLSGSQRFALNCKF